MITRQELHDLLNEVPEHAKSADRWSVIIDVVGLLGAFAIFLGSLFGIFTRNTDAVLRIDGVARGTVAAALIWAGFRVVAVMMRVVSDISKNTYKCALYHRFRHEFTHGNKDL